jgi:NAD(P)-dependent dehydrogenase (short-subunit alcohol dehydrogenase family)
MAGGAGGIGSASSIRLAEEGASVVVGDLDSTAAQAVVAKITRRGGNASALTVDISDEASVQALIASAVELHGGIDVVHINAADLSPEVIGRDSDVVSVPMEVVDRTLLVNARGHLLCARHAIPLLLQRGGGALVFTTSAAAFIGAPERPAYAMAKSAICALVRHIASRWGKEGIRANAVAPGLVLTEEIRSSLSPEFRDHALQATRSTRLGMPEDIAAMVAYLASNDGSWINGQIISVDGGAVLR